MYFWRLIFKIKVSCMTTVCFALSSFALNAFFFQFLSRDIRMQIPIVKRVQNGCLSRWKNSRILIKNLISKFNFQDEGHLDVNFLIYFLTIYCKCLLFQFFSCGIPMHILILTGVQNGRISCWKNNQRVPQKIKTTISINRKQSLFY